MLHQFSPPLQPSLERRGEQKSLWEMQQSQRSWTQLQRSVTSFIHSVMTHYIQCSVQLVHCPSFIHVLMSAHSGGNSARKGEYLSNRIHT